MTRVSDLIAWMESFAPRSFALAEDPVGLQAGRPAHPVKRALLALDASAATVAEARRRGCQLLLTHHPAFYRPLRNLAEEEPGGALAAELARTRLSVFSAHTNLDIAPGGVADCLADAAGIVQERQPLLVTGSDPYFKLAVFVPESHLTQVRRAICQAGAGHYGAYSECSFRVRGTGAFRCGKDSRPYIGEPGGYEETPEYRLEIRLRARDRDAVEAALRAAHPYETPAYEFYRLEESEPRGLGRVGELVAPAALGSYTRAVARKVKAPGAQLCGKGARRIRRVAVWSGSGGPIAEAARAGADLLVTGECSDHEIDAAAFHRLPVLRLGHHASEAVVLTPLARALRKAFPAVRFEIAQTASSPFINL